MKYRSEGREYVNVSDKTELQERIQETMPICHPLVESKVGVMKDMEISKRAVTLKKHLI